jgi:glycosyltransferase involved in cell wall biosynthesis
MILSVVIPVYNGALFIEKSYQSIINQKLDDFEILYVDNNSQDTSVKQINEILDIDARVKLLFQKKQGASCARNLGIKSAKGKYIYVFDVDDEIYPNALRKMIAVLDTQKNVDAVFGKMLKSYQGIDQTPKPNDETFEVVLKEKPYWGLLWFSSLKDVVGPPAFLYRKEVFEKIGKYNETIRNNEDTALDIKLGMTCNIAFLDMYVYLYFKHEASTIQQSKKTMPRAFMVWPRLVNEHLPFYLKTETPVEFKKILHAQLFKAMGKQLYFTKGYLVRKQLKQKLLAEIIPLEVSRIITLFLSILVILPFSVIIKFYGYYVVPFVRKRIK